MVNKARCKNCGDVIESKNRHDWVACNCFAHYETNGHHGIFLDGGNDYWRGGGNFDDLERIYDDTPVSPTVETPPKSETKCTCNKDECHGSCKKGD